MDDLVSVIVPMYNSEIHIKRCVESIQRQTYRNIEIILIDDKSADDTLNVCEEILEKDNHIYLIRNRHNLGSLATRKRGVDNAKGKYIIFVDSDDWIDEDMVEFLMNKIRRGYDFVSTGVIYEYENRKEILRLSEKEFSGSNIDRMKFIKALIINSDQDYNVCPSSCAKCYKSDFIKKYISCVSESVNYGEDSITTLLCIINAESFCVCGEVFYHYFQREDSKQHTIQKKYIGSILGYLANSISILNKYVPTGAFEGIDINGIYIEKMIEIINKFLAKRNIRIPIYYLPSIKHFCNKSIVLYGAGNVGEDYYGQIVKNHDCRIVHWVDKDYERKKNQWRKIESIKCLDNNDYAIVIIAVDSHEVAIEIKSELKSYGVDKEIWWEKPKRIYEIFTTEDDIERRL